MRILAMETSAKAASVCIAEDARILCREDQDSGLTHSRTLMPMAEHLLATAGLRPSDMDLFAVAAGPGSFTGVRIGVAAVKGLAFGADRPTVGVSTLAAMAWNVSFADGLIVCAMDARRAQVYNALFMGGAERPVRLTEDRAISLEALTVELAERALSASRLTIVGDGAALCASYLTAHGVPCRAAPPHLVMQSAAGVALEARACAAEGALCTAQELRPFYLRPPSAIPLREQKRYRSGSVETPLP